MCFAAVAVGECCGSGRPSNDYPAWETVYGYFNRWSKDCIWEKINVRLVKQVRKRTNKPGKKKKYRTKNPSAGSIDSQSIKTIQVGGDERGYDAGKCIKAGPPVRKKKVYSS